MAFAAGGQTGTEQSAESKGAKGSETKEDITLKAAGDDAGDDAGDGNVTAKGDVSTKAGELFRVKRSNGTVVGEYSTWSSAYDNASSGYTIEIIGDGVTLLLDSTLTITKDITLTSENPEARCTIRNSTSSSRMIKVNACTLTLKDIILDGNNVHLSSDSGAIVSVTGTSSRAGVLNIKDGAELRNGYSSVNNGGAVNLDNYGKANMDGGSIHDCYAENDGGGVSINGINAVFNMSGGTIEKCTSNDGTYFAGGGVCIYNGKFYMSGNAEIKDCRALRVGGGGVGINHHEQFYMSGGSITGCSAPSSSAGGGDAVEAHGDFYMSGGVITGNSSSGMGAVRFYSSGDGTGDGRLFVSGNPQIYGNGNRNVYIEDWYRYKIQVNDTLDEDALIYVYEDYKDAKTGTQFGKYATGNNSNLQVFRNDRRPFLAGADGGSNMLVWKPFLNIVVKADDTNGDVLPGSAFELYSNSTKVWSGTADDNGSMVITGVNAGSYSLKQTEAAYGAALPYYTWTITIDSNGEVTASSTNSWDTEHVRAPVPVVIDGRIEIYDPNYTVFEIVNNTAYKYNSWGVMSGEVNLFNLGAFVIDDNGEWSHYNPGILESGQRVRLALLSYAGKPFSLNGGLQNPDTSVPIPATISNQNGETVTRMIQNNNDYYNLGNLITGVLAARGETVRVVLGEEPVTRVPVYVRKEWNTDGHDDLKKPVSFTVVGMHRDSGQDKYDEYSLAAYTQESGSETVSQLTSADATDDSDVWERLVWVDECCTGNGGAPVFFRTGEFPNYNYFYSIKENTSSQDGNWDVSYKDFRDGSTKEYTSEKIVVNNDYSVYRIFANRNARTTSTINDDTGASSGKRFYEYYYSSYHFDAIREVKIRFNYKVNGESAKRTALFVASGLPSFNILGSSGGIQFTNIKVPNNWTIEARDISEVWINGKKLNYAATGTAINTFKTNNEGNAITRSNQTALFNVGMNSTKPVSNVSAFDFSQSEQFFEITSSESSTIRVPLLQMINTYKAGSRKVILRKVKGSAHTAQSGKTFTVYNGSSQTAYKPKGESSLSNLTSKSSGIIWIGELTNGWYIIKESSPEKYFYLIVTDSGVYGTLDSDNNDMVGGYESRDDAQNAAKQKYNSLK
ncbi:MAG: hypothetical protein E7219_02200 [Clostridiales bacterium]|nr:hypothetical protein [Clostridiales bacterium]